MHCISKFAVIWRRWLLALYSCCLVARKLIFNLLEGKGECHFPQTPSPLIFCSLYTRILCGAMKSFLTLSYVELLRHHWENGSSLVFLLY